MRLLQWKLAQFFEKKWWKNYLKKKDPNTYLLWKQNYWNTFLTNIGGTLTFENKQCLDIGSGPAGIFIISNQEKCTTASFTAVDPLLDEYQNLAVFNKRNYSKVCFESQAFENYETDKLFDIIFCLNAINHFKNIDQNLYKIQQLLKTDGIVILSTDVHENSFFKFLFTYLPFDVLHPHQYTNIEYQSKIKASAFEIIKVKRINKGVIFSYYVYVLKKRN
jgi:2-polyprenyl-3-methyl-5-hydroxy-6-metoxy-1,4-benzoquinol methylase